MPIPVPHLDDRDFPRLVTEALERIRAATSPEWTDFGPGDPGMTLVEAFAFLTETMIYRLNRVPDKMYRVFLNMIGVQLAPPSCAVARVRFEREEPDQTDTEIEIPRGTRVTVEESETEAPPEFVLTEPAVLRAGRQSVTVDAHHCELIDGELVGRGTGEPGLTVVVSRAPIAVTTEDDDLVVGVETEPGELEGRAPAREFGGKTFRLWREVSSFTGLDDSENAYLVDRSTGIISFAPMLDMQDGEEPRALAAIPKADREIRVWYRVGGGPGGNVAAGALTTILDPIPGLVVTNPSRAAGGKAAESLENALRRGPQQFHMMERVVTARDYEFQAMRSGAVSRAKAFTRRQVWAHAPGGEVEVVLVPHVPEEHRESGAISVDQLQEYQTESALQEIRTELDLRRPLGTACVVDWARYKTVAIHARVVVRGEEDRAGVEQRVLARLHRTVNPLPSKERVKASDPSEWAGWPFGQPLRLSDVYDIILSEAGVTYADEVRFIVEEVPDADVETVARDRYQPSGWYAGSGSTLFRSLNDGAGWEAVRRFPDEVVVQVRPAPRQPEDRPGIPRVPGWLGVVTRSAEEGRSAIYVSYDLGETWPIMHRIGFEVYDLAWLEREGVPVLMVATERGLYEAAVAPGAALDQIVVDASDEDLGFYGVAAFTDVAGQMTVAVAAREKKGVYLSEQGGADGTFESIGPTGEDARVLHVEYDGPATYLWAGVAAEGDVGNGVYRMRMAEAAPSWTHIGDGWEGGSCFSIDVVGTVAVAGSHRAGVQRLDLRDERRWTRPALDSGLPLREADRLFHPVRAVAVAADSEMLLAGGPKGIFRSDLEAARFRSSSRKEFTDAVPIPGTWLFVSGAHAIDVVTEDDISSR